MLDVPCEQGRSLLAVNKLSLLIREQTECSPIKYEHQVKKSITLEKIV